MKGLCWQINIKLSLFSAILLPLLIGLGFWQIQRANEKATILENHQQRQAESVADLNIPFQGKYKANKKIVATGHFDAQRYWLVEGKVRKGSLGYHVIMPFYLAQPDIDVSGESDFVQGVVLVDRGWVPAAMDRSQLPEILTPTQRVSIAGTILQAYDSPLIDEKDNPFVTWPHRILEIDLTMLSEQLHVAEIDILVLLSEENEYAFDVQRAVVNMPPAKHRAYAFQWFALALALLLLWLFASSNVLSLLRGVKK